MKDILEQLRKMDKKELSQAIKKAKEFAKTPEGQQMVEKIKKGEAGIDKSAQESLARRLGENSDLAKMLSDIIKE